MLSTGCGNVAACGAVALCYHGAMTELRALDAVNAYNRASQLQGIASGVPAVPQGGITPLAGGPSFVQMVNNTLDDSIATLKKSESLQTQSLLGAPVSLDELTAAVTQAEMTLRTVVAIRDRIVTAYQDIVKMPI